MGQLAVPIMIGAGIGGGLNLIRGKNPLQGALLGGAGGALTGGIGGAMGGGATGGAGSGLASGTGSAIAGTGIPLSAVQNGVGQGIQLAANTAPSTLMDFGITPLAAGSGLTTADLAFQPSLVNSLGGSGSVNNLAQYATGTGTNLMASTPSSLDKFYKYAKDYATPQNLLGVAQLATENNQAPLQRIGGGDISRGQMPQYVPFNVGEVQTWKKRGQA